MDEKSVVFLLAVLFFIIIALQLFTLILFVRERKQKENEYYTDYVHKNLVLRVFKPEFEYQAIGKTPIDKILDRGNLSQFYMWALIEN